jgi:hypothetical protein
MGQGLLEAERQIRKHPQLFTCANDFMLMKMLTDCVQSGAIGVNNAISWAHGEKFGRPKQPSLPPPLPEYDSCPHCHGSFSFTKLIGNDCPHCHKQVREPNAFAELMRGNPPAHQEVLSDIDATE